MDIFKLSLSQGRVIAFEVFDASGTDCLTIATTLRILDGGGVTIASANSGSGINACSALTWMLNAGTYYVRVEQSTNSATIPAYLLRVKFLTDLGSEVEPNDTSATATAFNSSDAYIFGNHQTVTDTDYYALTMADGTSLKLELIEGDQASETCENNGVDSSLTLFDANGAALGTDNDGGRGACSQIDGRGATPTNSFARNLAAGMYSIRVTSRTTAQSPENQFIYRLVVQTLVIPPLNLLVDNTSDDGGKTACDSNVANDCSLRGALARTNDWSGNDTISFDPTIFASAQTISLTNGELVVANNGTLTINGPGANLLTVQRSTAQGTPNFRLFTVNANTEVNLNGLTITGGRTADGPNGDAATRGGNGDNGGAIHNSGRLALNNVIVTGNRTGIGGQSSRAGGNGGNGGGIYNSGTLTVSNSALLNNVTGNGRDFGGNSGRGGGIYNSGTLTVSNSTFQGNSTGDGGDNGGAGGDGAGIYNAGTVSAANSTFQGNSTGNGQGQNSSMSSNGGSGGGIYNANTLSLTNCTLSANSTGSAGNVIPGFGAAGNGGGIFNGNNASSSTIRNTIVALNTTAGMGPDLSGGFTSLGYNLIGDNSGATLTSTTGDKIGTSNSPLNPKLGARANHGGPTQIMRLLFGSPAIDAGDDCVAEAAHCGDANLAQLTTDQRGAGFPRKFGAHVDIGAVEADYALAATGGSGQSATINSNFSNPLQATLTGFGSSVVGETIMFTVQPASNGASLSDAGLSATTNAQGQASITVTANAIVGGPYTVTASISNLSQTFNLTNACPSFSVVTPTNAAALGTAYNSSVTATPTMSAPLNYRYALANNTTLPAGLTLDAITGALTGTPTAPGQFSFAVKAELFSGNTATGCAVTSGTLSINITCVTNPVVTNTNDSGAGSLRDVIAMACPGSTITFNLSTSDPGYNAGTGGYTIGLTSGELVLDKNLTLTGLGANLLSVQRSTAQGTPDFRIFSINRDKNIALNRLTITNGKLTGGTVTGGGIFNRGNLTLTDCVITGNSTVASGNNSNFSSGGGIYNGGSPNPSLTLVNCTVSDNLASASGGNSASDSGGIRNDFGTVTLIGTTLSGNRASAVNGQLGGAQGGGILSYGGTLKLTNSTLSGNTASTNGSPENYSAGGGVSVYTAVNQVTLTNCTLSGNSAVATGNGYTASVGGGIYALRRVELRNTLLAGNLVQGANIADGPDGLRDVQGSFVSLGYNLIGNNKDLALSPATGDQIGTPANPLNPLLSALGSYGGLTQTLRPLPGSPAIDAGNNCVLTANGCGANDPLVALTTDQRGAGFNRQVGSAVDIGAVEVSYVLAATNGTPQTAIVNGPFAQPLQARLTESGNSASGVPLSFTAQPAPNGASATLGSPNPATTDSNGQASVSAMANGFTGGYLVNASVGNLSVPFDLANGCSTIVVQAPTPTLGLAGIPFSQSFTQTGGVGAVTFTLQSGTLPTGLTLAGNGVLSGVPVQTGSFALVVKATDTNGCSDTTDYPLVIGCPALTLSPGSLPGGQLGTNYAQQLAVSGAFAGSAAFSVSSGSLPSGLTLAANGVLSGMPTTVGSFSFTVKATDTLGCFGTQSYTVVIACAPLVLSPASLPNAQAGVAFTQNLSATGSGTRSFSLSASPAPPLWLTLTAGGVLSGTPPAPGSFSFVVNVVDAQGCTGTQAYTLKVGCPSFSLAGLPQATAGSAYNAQLTATPAGGSYQFSSSDQPAWLTLSSSGALSGTPPGAGTFSFNVSVTGFGNCPQTRAVTLTVTCPALALTPTSLPNANLGAAYSQTVTASPAGTSYTYLVTTNALPPGLTLNPATGVLSGMPTAAGNYSFVITATGWVNGAASCSGTRSYNLLVTATCPSLTLSPGSLAAVAVGTAYSQSFTAMGGTAPYSFAITAGTLPLGLTLASNGALSGTPSTAGTYSFTVTATGGGGCTGSQMYTLTLTCPTITLTPASLPSATAGVAYNQTVTASPAGNYLYSLATGNLPPGLSLNATTGAFKGTATTTGSYAFSLKAERGVGCSAVKAYTLVVNCPTVTVNPASLPNGSVGIAYNQTLSATPSGSYNFTVSSGSLPSGLTVSSAGVLSGAPTASGSFTFTVKATGFGTCFGTRSYTLTVAAACAPVTLPSLPNAVRGVSYYGDLSGTTPSGSYTFSLTDGALPLGLAIDNLFGALAGTPTASGAFAFTLKATSANGCSGTRSYTLVVGNGAAARAELADYDGDGQADPALWVAADGHWRLQLSSGAAALTTTWGAAGDVPLLGDYDGDGRTDLAVFRPSNATWYVQRSSDGQAFVKAWGLSTDVPVPGDYDGDGKTDLAVWRGSNGTWYVLRSADGQAQTSVWGSSAVAYQDVPVAGDFDGDGQTDVAVFRRTTGTWLVKRSSDSQFLSKVWGLGTDTPVAADYDGDGRTDLAIWRGKTGEWFVLNSADGSYQVKVWGAAGDVPVPGDYDGDGQSDLVVWRASEARWYLRLSGTQRTQTRQLGQSGDWPVQDRQRP